MDGFAEQQFEFTEEHFRTLQARAKRMTGINLTGAKRQMMYSRLSRRLRKLGLQGFDEYCQLLAATNSPELVEFVNALTTNLTYFFRESHHFDCLADQVLPDLLQRDCQNKRIRMWSAGCSAGQEAYSMAMVAREQVVSLDSWDFKILATDLDSAVVAKAKQGEYSNDDLKGLSTKRRRRWGDSPAPKGPARTAMSPALKSLITFKQLNLFHPWPMTGRFDVIFCRNVVIYFDKPAQRVLFDRLADVLTPDGHLFVGHSENLSNVSDRFQLIGQSTYKKVGT